MREERPTRLVSLPINHDIETSSRILHLYLELESHNHHNDKHSLTRTPSRSKSKEPRTPGKSPVTPKGQSQFDIALANRPGYVCIIGQKNRVYDGNTWYKIISSDKPQKVIHDLQPGSPYQLRLCSVYLVSQMLSAEVAVKQNLRSTLSGGCINGDWFKLDIIDLLDITEILCRKYDVLQVNDNSEHY
ncbi:unnamed protein product [Owenia fusiformis]|uniref:Uncharacterized protein n=1 Tax=Owenia fusiformis TaxID=6347 RepID=A0A8J1YAL0_OWEFU|nr:unnamed protein product [Owenia fusiformis]